MLRANIQLRVPPRIKSGIGKTRECSSSHRMASRRAFDFEHWTTLQLSGSVRAINLQMVWPPTFLMWRSGYWGHYCSRLIYQHQQNTAIRSVEMGPMKRVSQHETSRVLLQRDISNAFSVTFTVDTPHLSLDFACRPSNRISSAFKLPYQASDDTAGCQRCCICRCLPARSVEAY